jgi:mannosyltransferase
VSATALSGEGLSGRERGQTGLARLWPLLALMILAAGLRFATLDLQSFWYDEAFTPVHVLHPSLWATFRSVSHTENTPPLWYLLAWADSRAFGTGEIALRWPSALVGVAAVPVAWAIGRELTGRRATAIAAAGLVAVNPLLVWYSQEARAYGLFAFTAALAMLCFLRALHNPSGGRMAAFALCGALALLSHYFALFLLAPMALWLLWEPRTRRACVPALGVLVLVGLALLPLISAQGGRGTQWIGEWALSSRLQAIPQYYLTGYSGKPLGHGVELLLALPLLIGLGYGLWRGLDPVEERGAVIALAVAGCGILVPVLLALLGADYLAPRNLIGAAVPVSALLAVVVVSRRAGSVGAWLALLGAAGFLVISLDVDFSPRLQRSNWRGVADLLRSSAAQGAGAASAAGGVRGPEGAAGAGGAGGALGAARAGGRALVTIELGSAPLEYYLPAHRLARGRYVTVGEVDAVAYKPLRSDAARPPAPGFRLYSRSDVDGLILYRFVSPRPRTLSETALHRHALSDERSEVLIWRPGGDRLTPGM